MDINCAAIPESLIEGILFGTVKGAYTGAVDRAGLFEQANGGTIFLDEINSMPLSLQGKLLRVLQEKKVRRVGSLDTIALNVKIISSLNKSPQDLVAAGEFRMDLFYRLGVIYIEIPSLRNRRLDVEELGRHFLQKYNRVLGRNIKNISPEVIDFFWNYSWPGNVRELEHVIESAINMTGEDEKTLKLEHCYFINFLGKKSDPEYDSGSSKGKKDADEFPAGYFEAQNTINLALNQSLLEKNTIIKAIEKTGGNIAKASTLLGISRQLLGYKLTKHQLRQDLLTIKQKST